MLNISNITTRSPMTTPDATTVQIEQMDGIFRKVLIAQATLSTLANLMVVVIYVCMGPARKRFLNYLLFCMALSDLFVTAVSWYSYYASLVSVNWTPALDDVQVAHYGLYDYSFTLCLGTLLVVAIDRWYAVSRPIRHQEITGRWQIKLVILLVWVVALIPPLVRLGMADFSINNLYNAADRRFTIWYRSILIVLIVIILVVLTTTCIKVTMLLRRHHNNNNNKASNEQSQLPKINEKLLADKRNSRVIKIFIAMIIGFTITFLPITVAMFLHDAGALHHMGEIELVALTIFCDLFFFTSALVNPILTLSFHADFHAPLMKILKCGGGVGEGGVDAGVFTLQSVDVA